MFHDNTVKFQKKRIDKADFVEHVPTLQISGPFSAIFTMGKMKIFDSAFIPICRIKHFCPWEVKTNGFALTHGKRLQIYLL